MKMNWMTILARMAFTSSKPDIILSSSTGRNLSDICSVNSCPFLCFPRVGISYKIKNRIFYFTKSAPDKEIKRDAEQTGLNPIRVHDLRHSHASMLINMGFDIKEISERLGHESVKTTWDTYAHLYPDKDAELAQRLNELRRSGNPEE